MNPYATRVLEILAEATWDRINFGEQLDCSQGEETITDINLLDLKRAGSPGMRIIKTNKTQESDSGIDWEWWIGSDQSLLYPGWWRYAIQAKKLDKRRRYKSLRHTVPKKPKGTKQFQYTILKRYARKNKCIPLYALYNFVPANTSTFWHCCTLPYDQPQMGCTIAPIAAIAPVFRKGAPKGFEDVHSHPRVLPWRCLVSCHALLPQQGLKGHPLASGPFADFPVYDTLPNFLLDDNEGDRDFVFPSSFYDKQLGVYPKRIMVIDIGIAQTLG